MTILIPLGALLMGYVLGSISFSRVVARLASPEMDLRGAPVPLEGSEDTLPMSGISATSVRIKLGPRYGIPASLLDMLKVAIPVFLFQTFFPDSPARFFAAAGGILGHNWPLYYGFHGGYGTSAIYGAMFVLDWVAVPINFVGTALLYLPFRKGHIALLGGVVVLLPWLWYRGFGLYGVLYAMICITAYTIRLVPDIQTARKVRESETGTGKPAA